MRQTIIRYTLFCTALFVIGPLAWMVARGVTDSDGGHGVTLLNSSSGVMGLARGLVVVVLAGVAGLAAARWNSVKAGLWDAGVVLAWGAMGLGSPVSVMRVTGGLGAAGVYQKMGIESAVLGVLGVGLAYAICAVAARGAGKPSREETVARIDRGEGGEPTAAQLAAAVGVAALAAGVGVWIAAQAMLKGQAIFGAVIGGIVAGTAAFFVERRLPGWVPVAGVMIVAVVAPIALAIMDQKLGVDVLSGAVPAWGRVTPLDYLAGSFIGAQLGLSGGAMATGWAANTAEAQGAR